MKLYHLSFNDNLGDILYPRTPAGDTYGKPQADKPFYGEDLPPRVCFAPTVQGCFHGIFPNIIEVFNTAMSEHNGKFTCYLYEGLPDENTKFIDTSLVRKQVWDSYVTGEVCVESSICIRKLGRIEITIIGDGSARWDIKAEHPCGRELSIGPLIRWGYK